MQINGLGERIGLLRFSTDISIFKVKISEGIRRSGIARRGNNDRSAFLPVKIIPFFGGWRNRFRE